MSSNPDKLLPHPSFVYCAQFHNRVQKVVVTGSYDAIVRVWNLQTDDNNAQVKQPNCVSCASVWRTSA